MFTQSKVNAPALVSVLLALQLLAQSALAETDATAVPGLKEYDQVHSDSFETARTLMMKAESNWRAGRTSRALKQVEKALTLDNNDPDIHALYAQILEKRVDLQSERDQEVYQKCVNEWLLLFRQEIGEEKGLTIKGVGIGTGMFKDDFRGLMAKKHLLKLVGFLPKPWETDAKYIKRATINAQASVSATIKPSSQAAPKNIQTQPENIQTEPENK